MLKMTLGKRYGRFDIIRNFNLHPGRFDFFYAATDSGKDLDHAQDTLVQIGRLDGAE